MLKLYNIGNKYFFWNSNLTVGNYSFKMCLTYILILVCPSLFCIFEILSNKNSSSLTAMMFTLAILEISTLITFFVSSCTDPGVLKVPVSEEEQEKNNLKLVEYKNKTYALKFCNTCNIFRPLRAHHCKVCDVCIEELDHHCVWIGNCVGRRNRRKFFAFLISAFLLGLAILIFCLIRLIYYGQTLKNAEVAYLMIYMFLSAFFVSSLSIMLGMQFFLIGVGMTTNEYLRGTYTNIPNPFNQGCFSNYHDFIVGDVSLKNLDMGYFKKKEEQSKKIDTNASLPTNLN